MYGKTQKIEFRYKKMNKSKYISQEYQETFEQFLLDKMTPEERDNFLEQLQADKKLNTDFETFKVMVRTIEEDALKEKLNLFHKDLDDSKKQKTLQQSQYHYLIAATVTIFLLFGGYWVFTKQPKNEKLYATYFTPDPGLPTVMGNNNNYDFYEAMVDYKQANYSKAISKWKLLSKAKPNNDTLNYFLGVSYLNINNTEEASTYLNKVTSTQTSVFNSDAHLYYGLIQLKNNQIESAKKHLVKSNSETAKSLLKALE